MLFPKDEIIADIEGRIKRTGSDSSEWCIGIARDTRGMFFQSHLVEERNDGLLYREAFTPVCAREIIEYFVTGRGAILDASSQNDGRLVYAYRKTPLNRSHPKQESYFGVRS